MDLNDKVRASNMNSYEIGRKTPLHAFFLQCLKAFFQRNSEICKNFGFNSSAFKHLAPILKNQLAYAKMYEKIVDTFADFRKFYDYFSKSKPHLK